MYRVCLVSGGEIISMDLNKDTTESIKTCLQQFIAATFVRGKKRTGEAYTHKTSGFCDQLCLSVYASGAKEIVIDVFRENEPKVLFTMSHFTCVPHGLMSPGGSLGTLGGGTEAVTSAGVGAGAGAGIFHKRNQLIDEMLSLLMNRKRKDLPEFVAVQTQLVPVQAAIVDTQLIRYSSRPVTYEERCERILQLFTGVGVPVRSLSGSGGVKLRTGMPKDMYDTIKLEAALGVGELVSASLIMEGVGAQLYGEGPGFKEIYGLIYEPTLISVEFATFQDAYTKGRVPDTYLHTDGFYYTTQGKFIDYSKVETKWSPEVYFPDKTIAGLSLVTVQLGSAMYNEMLIRCKSGTMSSAILGGILINGAETNPDMVFEFRNALDVHLGPGFPIFSYDVFRKHAPLRVVEFAGDERC